MDDNKIKIAVLDIKITKNLGGSEVISKYLAEELSKYYEITYIGRPFDVHSKNIYPFTKFLDAFPIKKGLGRVLVKFPYFRPLFLKNLNLDYDLIISNSNYDNLIIKFPKKDNITYNSIIIVKHGPYVNFGSTYPDSLIKSKSFKIVALNKKEFSKLNSKYDSKNLKLVYPGIKLEEYPFDEDRLKRFNLDLDKKMIFSIGRLEEKQKKLSLALEAVAVLSKKYANFVYVIAGKGPDKELYERMVKRLNIQTFVKIIGFVSDEEKYLFIKNAAVVLQTSEKENLSAVMAETLSLGSIFLTTRNPSSEEVIIDNENGFFTEPSPEKIADKLLEIFNLSEDKMAEIRRNAINLAEKFTLRKMITEYINIIQELISSRG
jgi:glycosyltransferase involved in cell wall biosynthesis